MRRTELKRTAWNRTAATRTETDAKRRMERRVRAMRAHSDPKLAKWSKAVRERDEHTCQRCFGPGHHAHHICPRSRRPDLRLELSNGITVCTLCHLWIHNNPKESTAAGWLSDEAYEVRKAA